MENVIGGLVVAAVTGLAIMAYRHPKNYERILWPLLGLVMIGAVAAALWDIAMSHAFVILADFIDPSVQGNAVATINSEQITRGWIPPLVLGAIVFYLLALTYLKGLSPKENGVDKEGDGK